MPFVILPRMKEFEGRNWLIIIKLFGLALVVSFISLFMHAWVEGRLYLMFFSLGATIIVALWLFFLEMKQLKELEERVKNAKC